jgi:amidohydrolase
MTTLLEHARTLQDALTELRRDLHRHPELSFCETRTAATAAARVATLGYRVRTGVGRTGVVADLENGAGPTVALRADMDALPVQETSDVAYRSTVPGVMHACGHDAHVSMLVGAAKLLRGAQRAGTLPAGTVRLLFQPSEEASDEENRSGAMRMVDDGAMAGVDAVFGLHIGAHMPFGQCFLRAGPYMAGSVAIRATVHGHSAHAGRPHEGVDAIVLTAHAVLAVQNAVARRIAPDAQAVVHIGRIAGGEAENILAARVDLTGTIRYFDHDVRAVLLAEVERAFAVVNALGGRVDLEFREGYPPVLNDEGMTSLARTAIGDALGSSSIAEYEPWMGAEDFAVLLQHAPGTFFWLGAALDPPREHHRPDFDIDERALPLGAAALAACAIERLRRG